MKKKTYVLGMAVALAALLSLAGVAQSAMWVGGQIGGNFPLSSTAEFSGPGVVADAGNFNFNPSVIGGAQIGYNFSNTGFGAANYPSWMRFFSFAIDYTYNKLDAPTQTVPVTIPGFAPFNATVNRFKGYESVLTFLFMGQYGFMPDSEVPTGRINPYLGIGPAIVWSGIESDAGGRASATNVALVVEPGIRWMLLNNVSIDTAMRYRYASPRWEFNTPAFGTTKVSGLNQLAFLIRANYHF
jgi:opacity protein-like surface antigen